MIMTNNNSLELLEKYFDTAIASPDGIKRLRELILSLAMQGKLVPQDPTDQPASELLKEIEAEKKDLINKKKLKKGQITKDSKSIHTNINLPLTWTWVKGIDLFFITKLAGFEYTEYIKLLDEGEVPVIRAQNVKPFRLNIENIKYINLEISHLLERCALTKKALLVTFIGAGIGDVAIFDFKERWHLAPNVAKMEPFRNCEDLLDLDYFVYFLNSSMGRDEIFKHLKSTAQPSISMGTIRDIDYPLPPLPEQHRIVAKIDQLMTLCDQLEQQIDQSTTKQTDLLNAVIAKI
jgi:type I restriction enzyme S subunit